MTITPIPSQQHVRPSGIALGVDDGVSRVGPTASAWPMIQDLKLPPDVVERVWGTPPSTQVVGRANPTPTHPAR
jgi:hypothetical protein